MTWLLHNYFLPTLNQSTASQSQPASLRPLEPILKRYKSLLKITIRDASLRTRHKREINTVLRDIERWLAEAKVAANIVVSGFGWDIGPSGSSDGGDMDIKEKWALDRLCDGLLAKGGLVPLSKKCAISLWRISISVLTAISLRHRKRQFPTDSFLPPEFSVALWSPLLGHIRSHHPDFPCAVTNRILSYLLTDYKAEPATGLSTILPDITPSDLSFNSCLARWALWIIDSWNSDELESEFDVKKETIVTLITTLGPSANDTIKDRKPCALMKSVCVDN